MGKMALEHIPLIDELLWRRILEPAQVQPLWLEDEFSRVRLDEFGQARSYSNSSLDPKETSMKIAFFISENSTENPFYGTQRLAMEASARLHDVFYIDVDGFIYDSDDHSERWPVVPKVMRAIPRGSSTSSGTRSRKR